MQLVRTLLWVCLYAKVSELHHPLLISTAPLKSSLPRLLESSAIVTSVHLWEMAAVSLCKMARAVSASVITTSGHGKGSKHLYRERSGDSSWGG